MDTLEPNTAKRTARLKTTLTKRAVEALKPDLKPWIAWDDRLTGLGVRVQPSGAKTFVVNYRSGSGGRKAPNKRVTLGRFGRITAEQARRMAQELLGKVASGEDPAQERAEARGMPTLAQAFEDYLRANPRRKPRTVEMYRMNLRVCFGDWLSRSLETIDRGDVETRFHRVTERHGWATANQAVSMLRSIYRRSSIDHEGLRNPVELWIAGGGRLNRNRRRRISSPAEVLPRWRAGVEAVGLPPDHRDIFTIGACTGMRLGEVVSLRWERIDLERGILRVEETKTGEPLELPLTRQLAAVLERRRAGTSGAAVEGWVFPSLTSATGHLTGLHRYHVDISKAAGTRFWFHGLRNAFITVAERDLMLPRPLTKRLVNHARDDDITEGYAADWTVEQLREPAQATADRIEALMNTSVPTGDMRPRGEGATRAGLTAAALAAFPVVWNRGLATAETDTRLSSISEAQRTKG
ncbi:MAG: integrase family protein [Deltaproteobacteria bacterium]|nr:integrase family protein [Deltaproteobacteria bacterium]